MLFTPQKHGLWDTWIYPHERKFYLFWLQDRNRSGKWDSIGLAESDDLLHWREIGTIIEKATDAEDWMGTGRTWRAGDKFRINFSEFRGGVQTVYFAESDDLRTWRRLGDEFALRANARWYVTELTQTPEQWTRWDCLCPVRMKNSGWVGFLSAHSKNAPAGARSVVGAAASSDGVRWKAIPPASRHTMPLAEVSGTAQFGKRCYVFVSNCEWWGPRYDRFSDGPQGNGMWYWCAKRPEGPYAPPKHDHLLHGQRSSDYSVHFGTAFPLGRKWLWNHHWTDTGGRHWLGTIKELVEEKPWRLALRYWDGNDGLKGKQVLDGRKLPPLRFPQPIADRPLGARWRTAGATLHGETEGAVGLAEWDVTGTRRSGCMLTCELRITRNRGDGAGLFVGGSAEKPADGLALLLDPEGRATLGRTTMGNATPRLAHWETFAVPPFRAGRIALRLIARDGFVELYGDDRLLRTLRLGQGQKFNGAVGLWLDRCCAVLQGVRAWRLR